MLGCEDTGQPLVKQVMQIKYTIHGFAILDIEAVVPVDFVFELCLQIGAAANLVVRCYSISVLNESPVFQEK